MSLESIISTALMDTLLGMGSVFVILIFISLVISLFKFIPALEDRWKRFRAMLKKDNKQIAKTKTPEEPGPSAESVDPQTLAAITAEIGRASCRERV